MTPRHDPLPDNRFRFVDGIACAMLAIAIWSFVGIIAGWWLDDATAMWRFTWSLVISGAVLLGVGYYLGRNR